MSPSLARRVRQAAFLIIPALIGVVLGRASVEPSPARTVSTTIVISQFQVAGGTSADEFVELHNISGAPVNLAGHRLVYRSAAGSSDVDLGVEWTASTVIPAGGFYLIAAAPGFDGGVTPDRTFIDGGAGRFAAAGGGLALRHGPLDTGAIVDAAGYGTATNAFVEAAVTSAPAANTAQARRPSAAAVPGCQDTDNNSADFINANPSTPRNSASPAQLCTIAGLAARIHDIQGAGHISPLKDRAVLNVPGIVTALTATGFFMQDPSPDADDATSEGIFVFTRSQPAVVVGAAVTVSGIIAEFRPGGAGGLTNLTTTEIVSPQIVTVSTGNPLPPPYVIGADRRIQPTMVIEDDAAGDVETNGVFDPAMDGIDFYESLEGMRVQVNDAVVVGPRSAFGEIPVLADNGAGAGLRTMRGGIIVRPNDFNPERIILDDAIQAMPAVNVGDRFPGATVGVVGYSLGNFKLLVTQLPAPAAGGLSRESTATAAANQIAVATFNVENLDPGDPPAKFASLAGVIVDNLRAPDLIALEEVQDNSGPIDDAMVDAAVTFNTLIAAIQAAGGPPYQFRQINPENGQDGGAPGGNIRVGFLFRTDRGLAFIDRPGGTPTAAVSVVGSGASTRLSFSPGRIDPTNAAFRDSRKPLAGEFTYNGHTLFVVANHFNSKRGDEPLFGRFQPPARISEGQRHQQATIVNAFVKGLLAADPEANVIVLGDLNDFDFSTTLQILTGTDLVNLIETLPENERYTYLFEGNAQALDHILVSRALIRSRGAVEYDVVHVNAEFAVQTSDHDPQVARFTLHPRHWRMMGAEAAMQDGVGPVNPYVGTTADERAAMLDVIGVAAVDDLFADLPAEFRSPDLALPPPLAEVDVLRELDALAARNRPTGELVSFLGGGAAHHYVPSIVPHITGRSEFYTAYTPYQAEISQGTLQTAFEFQSMVCELTGMEVANTGMYDGASALAEACLMAAAVTGRDRVALLESIDPAAIDTVRTYTAARGIALDLLPRDGLSLTSTHACLAVQQPNSFGAFEDAAAARAAATAAGALFVVSVPPLSLGMFAPPGAYGAAIVVGDGQALGAGLNYGGPSVGLFACRRQFVRHMPGRIVGQTTDTRGRTGYVLTLQTREQHIRRERATSNICTSQQLVALAATVYLTAVGRRGIRHIAELCYHKAHYAAGRIAALPGFTLWPDGSAPVGQEPIFWNEFTVLCPAPPAAINRVLLEHGILGGLDRSAQIENAMTLCVTELNTKDEIDRLVDALAKPGEGAADASHV
jgi:glycine cleavage system pyridoxal-binding protein P/predicted extracellular nuclease